MRNVISFGNGEWLACAVCHHPLIPLTVVADRVVIVIGAVVVYRGAVVCGKCGTARDFRSTPAPAPAHKPSAPTLAGPAE